MTGPWCDAPAETCDACAEPMTNYDADGQWCDKHGHDFEPHEEDDIVRCTVCGKTRSGAISIIACSCGNFELHREGRLFHVADSRAAAERAVALILAAEAGNSQSQTTTQGPSVDPKEQP